MNGMGCRSQRRWFFIIGLLLQKHAGNSGFDHRPGISAILPSSRCALFTYINAGRCFSGSARLWCVGALPTPTISDISRPLLLKQARFPHRKHEILRRQLSASRATYTVNLQNLCNLVDHHNVMTARAIASERPTTAFSALPNFAHSGSDHHRKTRYQNRNLHGRWLHNAGRNCNKTAASSGFAAWAKVILEA